MDLLCINDSHTKVAKHPYLTFGEIYTATGETVSANGEACWVIPTLPNTVNPITQKKEGGPFYSKRRFIPLPDQPEEVIEETELAHA